MNSTCDSYKNQIVAVAAATAAYATTDLDVAEKAVKSSVSHLLNDPMWINIGVSATRTAILSADSPEGASSAAYHGVLNVIDGDIVTEEITKSDSFQVFGAEKLPDVIPYISTIVSESLDMSIDTGITENKKIRPMLSGPPNIKFRKSEK